MPKLTLLAIALAITPASLRLAADTPPLRPQRFAIIFNLGYAADKFPEDAKAFEKVIRGVRAADFNTVLCTYTDVRAKICKKYGLKIFVDLLSPAHHVYKNVEATEKLCRRLRGNKVVYGYHLWSDNIGNTYPGRSRDVKNVRKWDPTHPIYVGCYRMSRINRVQGMDLFGYYDFQWKRGGHWGHLSKASNVARGKDALFLRYCDAAPGRVGAGNPNRAGYTIATSIPFGLKGYLYHYGGGVVDLRTGQLDALGKDLQKVNGRFAAISDELVGLGNPRAVYSTPITKTAKDRPTGADPAVPGGLAGIPDGHWFQITAGEVLLGEFKNNKSLDVLALASHNAYQPQEVTLEFKERVKEVKMFDRAKKRWKTLKAKKGAVKLRVEEYATELVRVKR